MPAFSRHCRLTSVPGRVGDFAHGNHPDDLDRGAAQASRCALGEASHRTGQDGADDPDLRPRCRCLHRRFDRQGHARPAVPASRRRVPARPAKPVRAPAVSSRAPRGPSVAGPIPVPRALRRSFDAWVAEGAPTQRPIPWPRDRWKANLPQRASFFDELPERIGRDTVRTFTPSAADSPDEAVRALLAVMAWGAGRTGFWQWRTRAMLSCRDDAAECVQAVAATLNDAGPIRRVPAPGRRLSARVARDELWYEVLGPLPARRLTACGSYPRRRDAGLAGGTWETGSRRLAVRGEGVRGLSRADAGLGGRARDDPRDRRIGHLPWRAAQEARQPVEPGPDDQHDFTNPRALRPASLAPCAALQPDASRPRCRGRSGARPAQPR